MEELSASAWSGTWRCLEMSGWCWCPQTDLQELLTSLGMFVPEEQLCKSFRLGFILTCRGL